MSDRIHRFAVAAALMAGSLMSTTSCRVAPPPEPPPEPTAVEVPEPTLAPSRARPATGLWAPDSAWEKTEAEGCRLDFQAEDDTTVKMVHDVRSGSYVEASRLLAKPFDETRRLVFHLEASTPALLEIKLKDADGTVFGARLPLAGRDPAPAELVLGRENFEYWWGGADETLGDEQRLFFALSGGGAGQLRLSGIAWGDEHMATTLPLAGPQLDPNRELPGFGLAQRRHPTMHPEDPLVLAWLKVMQDSASPERALLPSMGGTQAQTFNNALVAMAFLLKGERERAERIFDFFAAATDRANTDPKRQNFFLNGEARGFYQEVALTPVGDTPAYHDPAASDRWMGDMVWLLFAYTMYERAYGVDRYAEVVALMEDLVLSYYTDAGDGPGGYIRHGWRKGDVRLHEKHGHPEGNIDCYALFRLRGHDAMAEKVRTWLDRVLRGPSLPLDLYSWRVLAFGGEAGDLLDIPDYDLRFRKTLEINGRPVVGFWHSPVAGLQNIWLDGTGHMACAYLCCGERERGYFYANQMDGHLFDKTCFGVPVRMLPYTANGSGGCEWVKLDEGFISVGAWYIFAKNGFNPMTLEQQPVEVETVQ